MRQVDGVVDVDRNKDILQLVDHPGQGEHVSIASLGIGGTSSTHCSKAGSEMPPGVARFGADMMEAGAGGCGDKPSMPKANVEVVVVGASCLLDLGLVRGAGGALCVLAPSVRRLGESRRL